MAKKKGKGRTQRMLASVVARSGPHITCYVFMHTRDEVKNTVHRLRALLGSAWTCTVYNEYYEALLTSQEHNGLITVTSKGKFDWENMIPTDMAWSSAGLRTTYGFIDHGVIENRLRKAIGELHRWDAPLSSPVPEEKK